MRSRPVPLAAAILLLVLSSAGFLSRGIPIREEKDLRAEVTAVYDGDTIKVKLTGGEETRVRLIGIDAPESADEREAVRMMAFLAKRFAYLRLYGKGIRLTLGPEPRDAFGRLLAFVWLEDGMSFNETMIREGFAFGYFKFPFDDALKTRFEAAEAEARRNGAGLWRREPWPQIGPEEAGLREGEIVTVRFVCAKAADRGGLRILDSGRNFQAVVPRDLLPAFPGSLAFEGRTLRVTGIIESFRGVPQIMIGLPGQIEMFVSRL